MIISIFKTNIRTRDLAFITSILDHIDIIESWSTDLEDCDNILRIVSSKSISSRVINALNEYNFHCEEIE